MLPDRVSNPGPLTYESGALPIALRGPAYPPRIYRIGNLCESKGDISCSIPGPAHTFVEINNEIFSAAIPSTDSRGAVTGEIWALSTVV